MKMGTKPHLSWSASRKPRNAAQEKWKKLRKSVPSQLGSSSGLSAHLRRYSLRCLLSDLSEAYSFRIPASFGYGENRKSRFIKKDAPRFLLYRKTHKFKYISFRKPNCKYNCIQNHVFLSKCF